MRASDIFVNESLRHLPHVWHHVGMTKDELRTALVPISKEGLEYVSKWAGVDIGTLRRIRSGRHKASPLTLKAVAPVLARMAKKGSK